MGEVRRGLRANLGFGLEVLLPFLLWLADTYDIQQRAGLSSAPLAVCLTDMHKDQSLWPELVHRLTTHFEMSTVQK